MKNLMRLTFCLLAAGFCAHAEDAPQASKKSDCDLSIEHQIANIPGAWYFPKGRADAEMILIRRQNEKGLLFQSCKTDHFEETGECRDTDGGQMTTVLTFDPESKNFAGKVSVDEKSFSVHLQVSCADSNLAVMVATATMNAGEKEAKALTVVLTRYVRAKAK